MKKLCMIISTVILLLTGFAGCQKTKFNEDSPVPRYTVSFTINYLITAPILETLGGYYTITEPKEYGQYIGYSGLVIFHGFDEKFYAFDLCCPNECDREVRVEPSSVGIATCPECGSEFDIGFGTGTPTKGPATSILRRYNVSVNGTVIRVTN